MTDEAPSWTKERVEQLRTIWPNATLSASMIGKIMGMTKNQIIGKVHRLGLKKRQAPSNLSPERLAENKAKRDAAKALLKQKIIPVGVIGDKIKLPEGGCRWIDIDPKERPDSMTIEEMHCRDPIFANCYCHEHFERAYKKRPEKENARHAQQD